MGAILQALPAHINDWDFSIYYLAGRELRVGHNPYLTDLSIPGDQLGIATKGIKHAADTPTFLLCFSPLTRLPLTRAYWAWFSISMLCLFGAGWLLLRPLGARLALTAIPLAIIYPPFMSHMFVAQSQIMILFLLACVMRLLESSRQRLAGAVLGLAILLRAYPGVFLLYLIARRRWAALSATVATCAVGGLATIATVGMAPSLTFFRAIRLGDASGHFFALPAVVVDAPWNVALAPTVGRLLKYLTAAGFHRPGEELLAWTRRVLTLVADGTVLWFTWAASRATKSSHEFAERAGNVFVLWVPAMIMLSPIAWYHYLVLLFIPYSQMLAAGADGSLPMHAARLGFASYILTFFPFLVLTAMDVGFGISDTSAAWAIAVKETAFLSLALAYLASHLLAIAPSRAP